MKSKHGLRFVPGGPRSTDRCHMEFSENPFCHSIHENIEYAELTSSKTCEHAMPVFKTNVEMDLKV